MSTKEKMPISKEKSNPIPETKEQGKTKSDRMHFDPIEKKAFDIPNSGGKSGK